ncbi:hypothetical protein LSAT2_024502 [Lamellibrachia satsuma]|nr:hypothetical protein LSAT2_024502 [Lamellibrachia satsuma]
MVRIFVDRVRAVALDQVTLSRCIHSSQGESDTGPTDQSGSVELSRVWSGKNLSHSEITERVNTAIMDEFVRRVFEAICTDEELESLQPKIGDLLVQQATCVLGMHQAVENLKAKLYKHKQELGTHLVKAYPLRSRIEAWVNEKFMEFQKEFIEQHQWSAHEETMEVCRRQKLDQAYYFVHRDLIFMRDQEPVLRKELSKVRQANRVFTFHTRIWLPSNWVVTRTLYGQTDIVPTVVVNNPAAYTGIVVDPDQPKYDVRKYTWRKTNTRYPFWRWLNYCHRTWAWTWNAMFWLGLVVPWCSPVSLRALFFPFAFMPDLELSQVSGNLCPKTSSLTHTLLSRLRLLWHHVHESRAAFENSADKGFLGKSFSRHINRFWNYVMKGVCGSAALVLGLTPLCLTVSTLSLLAAITAPLCCSNWVDFVKSWCEKSWAEVQADSFSFECRGCARMKELEVELEELRLLVVAMVGREQGSCASSSGGGTVDDKVGKDTRDARESSPQPGRKLRGGKVTGHRETGRKETGRKGMGGKTTRVKERGVGETGGKEKGVGETEGKTTGVKERGVGDTRAKEWEVGATGGKGSGQNVMEGIERKSYSAAVIEGVRKRARVFVGDSIVRKTDRVLNKGDDVVVCLPGAKIEAITERVKNIVGSVVVHLSAVLIYDFDRPGRDNPILYLFEALFYRFLLHGCLQPVAAILVATLCCPLASFFIITAGVVRRGLRAVWDTFMFHAIIKSRGHVPAHDSFIARRITGPGLASNYFYQVHPSQALAAVESRMEQEELKAWRDDILKVIEQPKKEFQKFVTQCFHPFSAVLCEQGVYRDLVQETKHLCEWLQTKISERQKHLHTGLNPDIRARVKVSGRELKVIILQTANMLEEFYPSRVIRRLSLSEEMFWESRHLEAEDWRGLASQLLAEVFSSAFLTPLEATDTCFRLEVQHLNLMRYVDMLKSSEFRDDLDVVSTIHTPKGDIDVDAPFLQIRIFNPVHDKVAATGLFTLRSRQVWRKPWKRTTIGVVDLQKLEIPLPIAHPSVISVLMYNRENDQEPIDLDDVTCQRILQASELLSYTETPGIDTDTNGDLSTPDHLTNSEAESDIELSFKG